MAESTKKPRGKAFPKGKSPNPGGRPAKTEEQRTLEAQCREQTPAALAVILSMMTEGEQERNRLSAAQYVIDRGWGKAKESIEHSGGVTLTIAEQIKKAHEARKLG